MTITASDAEKLNQRIEVDAQEAELRKGPDAPLLIQVSLESLVHDLIIKDRAIADVSSRRGAISNELKRLKESREELIAEIKSRDPEALPSDLVLEPREE
jgi:hypothetical protein